MCTVNRTHVFYYGVIISKKAEGSVKSDTTSITSGVFGFSENVNTKASRKDRFARDLKREYKYVIYDNEVEDKRILAVYGIRTNYDRATTREIAEYLYDLEEHGYVNERMAKEIYNRIGRNYGALLGKYDSKNSRFVRSRRWNTGIGEVNGEGTSGEGVPEGVKYSRRDRFAREVKV